MYALALFVTLRDRLTPAASMPATAGEPPLPLDEATLSAWGAWAARGRTGARADAPTGTQRIPAASAPSRRSLGGSASS